MELAEIKPGIKIQCFGDEGIITEVLEDTFFIKWPYNGMTYEYPLKDYIAKSLTLVSDEVDNSKTKKKKRKNKR